MAIDSQWSNVTLLLPMEGVNGQTIITDVKGHVVTVSNGAALSTAVGTPFGAGTAAYFDGSNDVLAATSADFTMGTGDFSIKFAFYPLTGGHGASYGRLLAIGPDATSGSLFISTNSTNDPMTFILESHNGSAYVAVTDYVATTVSNGAWHWAQLDRVGGVFNFYVDGTLYATKTVSRNLTRTELVIGNNVGAGSGFKGYIGPVYILKGAVSSSHAVPSGPFPRPTITGVVRDAAAAPVANTILVRDRNTQVYIGGANSDPTTGIYTFYPPDFGEVQVIRVDGLCDTVTDECVFDLVFPTKTSPSLPGIVDSQGHPLTFGSGLSVSAASAPFAGETSVEMTAGGGIYSTSTDFVLGYGDFSIEFWFNVSSANHGDAWARLIQIGNDNTPGSFTVWNTNTNNPATITAGFWTTAYQSIVSTIAVVSTAAWHAMQIRRVAGVFEMILDGVSQGTSSQPTYNLVLSSLSIGANPAGGEKFNGSIGPVRIFYGPRRASQITPLASFLKPLVDGTSGENAIIYDRVIPGS